MKNAKYIEDADHFDSYNGCYEYVLNTISYCHENPDDYDIDAIIDEAFCFVSDPEFMGWQIEKDDEDYWDIVASHNISE